MFTQTFGKERESTGPCVMLGIGDWGGRILATAFISHISFVR